MLRVCPWNRLGLTIRWLNQEYIQEFPSGLAPPLHMPIAFGPIDSASSNTTTRTAQPNQIPGDILCQLCLLPLKVTIFMCAAFIAAFCVLNLVPSFCRRAWIEMEESLFAHPTARRGFGMCCVLRDT